MPSAVVANTPSVLSTDRPGETLSIFRPAELPLAEFWHVQRSDRHWEMLHDTYTVCLVLEPRALQAQWHYRGARRWITAGQMQCMEPGEAHRTTYVSEPADFFVTFLKPALVEQAASELGWRGRVQLAECQFDHAPLSSAFGTLRACLFGPPDPLALECCFAESLSALLERCRAPTCAAERPEARHPGIRRARAYLEEHAAEPVTLGELAKQAGMARFYFARSFTQSMGIPPHRFLTLLRVRQAQRRIEQGATIAEAAALAGFADQPHFTRKFRSVMGVTPSHWVRALGGCRAYADQSRDLGKSAQRSSRL